MIYHIMTNKIVPYLCYRLGMGTLPMITLMSGELIVYWLFGRIVVVPVPFGIGTSIFNEIYDHLKNRSFANRYLLTAEHITP